MVLEKGSTVPNGGSDSNIADEIFSLLEGDVKKSIVNGILAIDFSDRVQKLLVKDMSTSVILKLLGRNIGFTTLQNKGGNFGIKISCLIPYPLSLNIDDRGSDLRKGNNFSALNKKGKEIINIDVGKDTAGGKSPMIIIKAQTSNDHPKHSYVLKNGQSAGTSGIPRPNGFIDDSLKDGQPNLSLNRKNM
ncbi:hypothetical protein Golob_024079 [Gossypium lobatum]|uniref:Uncharacterized protein n=1 Tax=Gossypium lobatum TaxID=34289 RepID=A0A7J8NCU9_9ROSI|nr:hypothetical protein [Gossypium lobatum]